MFCLEHNAIVRSKGFFHEVSDLLEVIHDEYLLQRFLLLEETQRRPWIG